MSLGSWSSAVNAESIPGTHAALNSAALDGCPFVAQRDDILYFASGPAGGAGGLEIWYSPRGAGGAGGAGGLHFWSSRRGAGGGWAEPVNFAAVNSAADDFCPMAHRNGRTF